MNSSNVLLLCIQMHVYIPFLISPLVLLFQIDLHVLDFVSIWYSLCFCFCFFRTRTVLHLLLCLLFYCCLPLHPLNLLIYLRYTRLSKFTCTLPLCFPLEKILLGVLYMLGPHFFFFFIISYSLFNWEMWLLFLPLHDLPIIKFPSFLSSFLLHLVTLLIIFLLFLVPFFLRFPHSHLTYS